MTVINEDNGNDTNDNSKGDESNVDPILDQNLSIDGVLSAALSELGEEGEDSGSDFFGAVDPEDDKGGDDSKGAKDPKNEEDDKGDDPKDDKSGDDDVDGDDDSKDDDKSDGKKGAKDTKDPKESEDEDVKHPNIDDKLPDVPDEPEKPELQKVTVKDSNGVEHEFASSKDIPDDFEPYTYKAFAEALEQMSDNKDKFKEDMATYNKAVKEREDILFTHSLKKGWDEEIETLVKSGLLPKDETKKRTTTSEVFAYMMKETQKGNKNMSFTAAYKSWKFDNLDQQKEKEEADRKAEAEKQKKIQEKKRRGGLVSGNKGGRSSQKESARDTVPRGLSVSQVEAELLKNL